jgi:hypothetical protein
MDLRETIARQICVNQGVNPDSVGWGVGKTEPEGSTYKLHEYFAKHYVDVVVNVIEKEYDYSLENIGIFMYDQL